MKKILSLVIPLFIIQFGFTQNFNIDNNTVNLDCVTGGVLFDSGGGAADYLDNENFVFTICPSAPGFGIFATMSNLNVAVGDQLTIYNGNSTAAPSYPDMPLDNGTTYNTGAQFQSTVANPTGCLTFEFISNGDGDVGSFDFLLECEARCQNVLSQVTSTIPDTTSEGNNVFVNICLGDTLFVNANALFPENNTEYNQSEATSDFNWSWGDGTTDEEGQNLSHYFSQPGGYLTTLQVIDVNGCLNYQNQFLKIRVAPEPEFIPLTDTILCFGEIDTLIGLPQGTIVNGQVVQGDTVYFTEPFFSGDSLALPDGNGAGYSTSTFISNFNNSDTVTNCGNILELCVNIEHSFLGDLGMTLTCPNGQSVSLLDYPNSGGATFLGDPVDEPFGTAQVIGDGLQYCFSSSGITTLDNGPNQVSNNPGPPVTTGNTIVPGDYLPVQPFTNLIGCPLNGQWTLNISDNQTIDDGYLFNWELNIHPCLYPQVDSFIMNYDYGYWDPSSTITGIVNDSNTIIIEPDSIGPFSYTYNTSNQFGCEYSNTYDIEVDGFDVLVLPEDTTLCEDTIQLLGQLENFTTQCETDYIVSTIPVTPLTTAAPTNIALGDDAMSPNINIPFPFEFFCETKNTFQISSNGFLTFTPAGSGCCSGQNLPTVGTPNDLIALFWSDLNPSSGGQVSHFVTGTAPNRVYVVNFLDVPHFGSTRVVTGQIQLHETSNFVEIHCVDCQTDAGIITSGIENSTGTLGYASPGHNATSTAAFNLAWRFTPTNSLGNFTFNWTPAVDISATDILDPMVWPSTSTDYILDVTNLNNCTYSDTASIAVGGAFQHDISNDTIICEGESVQLEVTGGALTIAWTPNDGTISDTTIANPIFSPTTTTTYTAALDSNSCETLETVTVYVSNLIVDSTIVINESCAGANDGSIEFFTSNGVGSTLHSIDNGANFSTDTLYQNLMAGIYDIIVTDSANCDTTYQVTIAGGSPLIYDSIVGTDAVCGNVDDGTISIYASGGVNPLTYSIDSGASFVATSVFTDLNDGLYYLSVQDSLGCAIDTTITINQPDSLILGITQNDSLTCYQSNDGQVILSAAGGITNYEYSIDGINFLANNTFSTLSAGNYTFYLRDANLCLDSLDVTVGQPDSLFITNVVVDSTNCNNSALGSLISFDASGGTGPYTYAISGVFGMNNVFNDIPATTYQLEVLDANNCSANVIDTNVFEPTLLEFVLDSIVDASCGFSNGAIYVNGLGGTAPYSYTLDANPAQNNGTFQNLISGIYTIVINDANACDTTQTINLGGTPPSEIGLVNTDSVSCFGLNDGLIEVEALNGTAPFEFSIDNGLNFQTSGIFNNLPAAVYTILIRDSLACTDTLMEEVFQPTLLSLTAQSDSTLCFNSTDGVITLTASGGSINYQYSISDDANLQSSNTFNTLGANNYTAYVVDANGCRDSVAIEVFQPDSFFVTSTLATNVTCFGDADGTITVNLSGGSPTYTYSVDNANFQTSNVLSNLSGGNYTIFVLDGNNCPASAQDSIYEPADLTLVVASSSNITCNGGADGSIDVTAGGGVIAYQYSLDGTNFQASNVFSNLTEGSYTITVQDANNCTETTSITLTEPNPLVVVLDSTNIQCFGDTDGEVTITSISGETAPYSVIFDGGIAQNYTPGLSFDNLAAGAYSISIQDANGCPTPAYTNTINIVAPNVFEIDTFFGTDPLCFGGTDGSLTILSNNGGIAPYVFNIFNAGDTTTNLTGEFDNLEAGDYALWIVDQNGCTDQDIYTLDQPDELVLIIDTAINPGCFGYEDGQILVSAEGGTPYTTGTTLYDFVLSDGTEAVSGAFVGLEERYSYEITVTDANGCTDTQSQDLIDPEPVFAEITPEDPFIEMGDTLNLNVVPVNASGSDFVYVWSPNLGLSCTDCANPSVAVYNDQEYALTFYDENGCSTTASVFVEVSDTLRYFVPNAFTPGGFDDMNNAFMVYGQDLKFVDMMIFNRWGEKIYESSNTLSSWDGTYKGILQNPGVYTFYVKITFLNDEVKEEKGSVTLLR